MAHTRFAMNRAADVLSFTVADKTLPLTVMQRTRKHKVQLATDSEGDVAIDLMKNPKLFETGHLTQSLLVLRRQRKAVQGLDPDDIALGQQWARQPLRQMCRAAGKELEMSERDRQREKAKDHGGRRRGLSEVSVGDHVVSTEMQSDAVLKSLRLALNQLDYRIKDLSAGLAGTWMSRHMSGICLYH